MGAGGDNRVYDAARGLPYGRNRGRVRERIRAERRFTDALTDAFTEDGAMATTTTSRGTTSRAKRSRLDALGAFVGSIVYRRRRLFRRSLDSPPLRTAVPGTTVNVGSLEPGAWHAVRSDGPAGQFDAAYLVHRWIGPDRPGLIYVHGSGEQPRDFGRTADNSFRRITEAEFDVDANLLLVMAPFHDAGQGAYIDALGDLRNYVGMLATATALVDALATRLRGEGAPEVHGAGFSLGGWVLNLHRAFHGTGIDRYVPICAGTKPHAIFVDSVYRRLVDLSASAERAHLEDVLGFEAEFKANTADDCRPLLFRYDALVDIDVHLPSYAGMQVEIIDKGHFGGQQAIPELRAHIRRATGL